MLNIIHFHPSLQMAKRFVNPLIQAEKKISLTSRLVISEFSLTNNDSLYFNFKLSFLNIFLFPLKLFQICIFIKSLKPNVIISHNSISSILPLLGSKLINVKNRIYFNHGVPYVAYTGFKRLALYVLEYLNCFLCTEIISVSDEMKNLLNLMSKKKISVINNGSACGIDLKKYKSLKKNRSFFPKNLDISNNDFLVIYVGRPVKRKGFEHVILMWEKYIKNKKTKLLLCGCDQKDVLNLISHVPKNIIPLGFVNSIEEIYKTSDLLILPSFHEGLPYAILEAMASKCVVLANNILGIRSIVQNHFNGILIDDNDIKSYVKKINLLSSNKTLRDQLSKNALIYSKKFSRNAFIVKYVKFLNEKK